MGVDVCSPRAMLGINQSIEELSQPQSPCAVPVPASGLSFPPHSDGQPQARLCEIRPGSMLSLG